MQNNITQVFKSSCIIIILVLGPVSPSMAQSDTILVGYSSETGKASWINEMLILDNGRYGLLQSISEKDAFEVSITDSVGSVLFQSLVDSIDGFDITFSSFMFEDVNSYFYIGNAQKKGRNYFLSLRSDKHLSNFTVIDTLQLNEHNQIFFEILKLNDEELWEGFGVMENKLLKKDISNIYISLDSTFHFQTYSNLDIFEYPSPILDFVWIPEIESYFIVSFGNKDVLITDSLKMLWDSRIEFSYERNEIIYHTYLSVKSCFLESGNLICYGQVGNGDDFGIATLKVSKDSMELIQMDRYYDKTNVHYLVSQMCIDEEGNYIISGTDNLTFKQPTLPNRIDIVKISTDNEIKWSQKYEDDKSFVIWDMEIDESNNILVVGSAQNMFGDHEIHGFLLKIFEDGSYTMTYTEPIVNHTNILIFPNPSSDYFNVVFKENINTEMIFSVYDLSGRIVLEKNILESSSKIYISHLSKASYYYRIHSNRTIIDHGHIVVQ